MPPYTELISIPTKFFVQQYNEYLWVTMYTNNGGINLLVRGVGWSMMAFDDLQSLSLLGLTSSKDCEPEHGLWTDSRRKLMGKAFSLDPIDMA